MKPEPGMHPCATSSPQHASKMAEKVLKKVEDHLNCSICLDTYTDPKLLQCFHVYCRQCLVKLVYRDEHQQLVLSCPICRQVSPIPARGVAGLPSAFHINQLLEIVDTHKKEEDTASNVERAGGASASNVPQGKVAQSCPDHDGKELELYCETCEDLVCFHCTLKNGRHHSHDCELLSSAFEKYKEEIKLSVEPMEKQRAKANEVLAQLDACREEISDQRAFLEADIRTGVQQLRKDILQALEVRETELISQLDQMTQGKLKGLAVQRDQIETTQAQLGSCLDFMKHSLLQTDSQGDVLRMRATIAKQVRELTTASIQPELSINADITFSTPVDVATVFQNHGELSMKNPCHCEVRGQGLVAATVGATSTVKIDTFGRPWCSLVAERTGVSTTCRVRRTNPSQCEVSYQPVTKGRHLLHIQVDGHHVTGSPFSVNVRSQGIDFAAAPQLLLNIGVSQPRRVAVNEKGELVVVELGKECISVFNQRGEKVRSFGGSYSGHWKLRSPHGVAVDGEGNILVTDGGNDCIVKFTADGQFLASVGSSVVGGTRHPLHFACPYGIAFNASNNKIYVSDDTGRVQVLNSDLTFSSAFGRTGSAEGCFMSPRGIACDSSGKVYVADSGNSRIQVFTADGLFLMILRHYKSKLLWPAGVAVDSVMGVIFVSEHEGDRISIFNDEGQFLMSFGGVSRPIGLAVDTSGVLYVCDQGNRVIMF